MENLRDHWTAIGAVAMALICAGLAVGWAGHVRGAGWLENAGIGLFGVGMLLLGVSSVGMPGPRGAL